MKVFVKRVNESGEVVEVPQANNCKEYAKLIGCDYASGVSMPRPLSNVYMFTDDVGKFKGLKPNFYIAPYDDLVVGTAVFVGIGEVKTTMPDGEVITERDFCSLSPAQIQLLYSCLDNCH